MFRSLLLALVVVSPAAAQEAGKDIVVTGTPLRDTERRLADCLARKCPPAEDIAASLAHAENLFVSGAYLDARRVTARATQRNRRYAAQLPIEVSGLFRADSRIATHMGEARGLESSANSMVRAIKAGLPEQDPRVLATEVERADTYAILSRFDDARRQYRSIADRARDAGVPRIEGYALLREAVLEASLAQRDPAFVAIAETKLDALVASTVPEHKPFATAARLMKARIAARGGDSSRLDRLIREIGASARTRTPRLIHADPIDLGGNSDRAGVGGTTTNQLLTRDVEDQWVDVAFMVTPEGRTAEAEVLRTSPDNSGDWADAVLRSIASRRYVPLDVAPGDPGSLRVERFTLTSHWTETTGTRIRTRSPVPRIEVLDLTAEPAVASAEPRR